MGRYLYSFMIEYTSKPFHLTSVRISPEFYQLCKQHHIKFSEAIRVGIAMILAEKGVKDYDNSLTLVRRCNELQRKAGEYAQKAANLENETPS